MSKKAERKFDEIQKNYIILYSVNKKSKEIYILHIYYKSRNYQY